MKRFAVDFVILPPAPIVDVAITLNKQLCNSNILFHKENCFPHLSLLMGCLTLEQLGQAKSLLKALVSQYKPMDLKIPAIRTVGTTAGDVVALDVEPNDHLQSLHESVVKTFGPMLSEDATTADVFGDLPANQSTLGWINSFIRESTFDNFWPHITIGYLKTDASPVTIDPISFTASRIAICHLGNFCTCREILKDESLIS
jgi:hypothetical protein